ncbi:expressed protein [Phakopsora pachyrhizi]|uniref:Expressed protein n=1 Tax=Phakopsora pachyrhizi TaxID=170000 RepID=A0AAV0BU90_PHAPC|nr:expressed protein [Phakopsora pachyrhizi]
MIHVHFHLILLSFLLGVAILKALNLRVTLSEHNLEFARETLTLNYAAADSKISAFRDLFSISKVDVPMSAPTHYYNNQMNFLNSAAAKTNLDAIGDVSGHIINTRIKQSFAYSNVIASIASRTLDIVQYQLRKIHKPNNRVLYFPIDFYSNYICDLDEVFFDSVERKFIQEVSGALKRFKDVENSTTATYFLHNSKIKSLKLNFISWNELVLRSLNCLLLASPSINNEGRKISREVIKDKEVLEIIKDKFSATINNSEISTDVFVDFSDYLKQNSWSKGISNIYKVFFYSTPTHQSFQRENSMISLFVQ